MSGLAPGWRWLELWERNIRRARAEARAALDCSAELGARRLADEAAALLRQLGDRARAWPRRSPGNVGVLTGRENEVLALLAEGRSNADIAAMLVISPRTAEHHVSNILAKLGLASRAEVAARVVRRGAGRGPSIAAAASR